MSRRAPLPGLLLAVVALAAAAAALVLLVLPRLRAAAEPPHERRVTLENGLQLRLVALPSATRTAIVARAPAGEDHDPPGASGRAHLAEHLFVTAATEREPARTAEAFAARYPDGWNAQTGARATVIAVVVPPARLEEELGLLAARLTTLAPTEADLTRERPRLVAELANMYGGMPALAASNGARLRARPPGHGGRTGGVPVELEALGLDALREAHAELYAPGRLVLAIAGPFELDAAEALARRLLGGLPAGPNAPTPAEPREGPPGPPLRLPGFGPTLSCVALRTPPPGAPELAPFVLLAARVLQRHGGANDGGPASRWAPLDEPELLYVCAAGEPEASLARLEAVARAPLEPAEAERAIELFGPLLRTRRLPAVAAAEAPYVAALALAAEPALGLDGDELAGQLREVTPARFAETMSGFLAAEHLGVATAGGTDGF